jgi:penicillin-binding protein 2
LVDKIVDSDKNVIKTFNAEVAREGFIDQAHIETMKKAMRQTAVSGSASLLNDLKIEVAGKTGTAQVAGQKDNNAWFTAFAPYNDPEIVIAILIEEGGEGSRVSAPVAKEVLKWYFDR